MAITNPQVLIVGRDVPGAEELRRVLGGLSNLKPVMHDVRDPTLAGDAARTWQPHVAMVQMTGDLSALRAQVRDIRVASPETAVVGVFRPDLFPPDTSESAILIQAIRVGVQDFVRRPVSSHDLAQLMDRLLSEPVKTAVQPATVASFISCKGGIGKSTLAVNVAVGLARRHPERVLLLDCSLQMGVCAALLGLRPQTSLLDVARERHRLDDRMLEVLAGLEFPPERQAIVLNRFLRVADALRKDDVEAKLNRAVDHVVGFDRRVLVASNIGEPYLLGAPRFASARRAILRLVDEVEGEAKTSGASKPKRESKWSRDRSQALDTKALDAKAPNSKALDAEAPNSEALDAEALG